MYVCNIIYNLCIIWINNRLLPTWKVYKYAMCFFPDITGHQGITFGIISCPEHVYDSDTVFW